MAESRAEVAVSRPTDGVAVVTYSNPAIRNHLSWEGADAIAAGLVEAREGGARVSVLASGLAGHWIEHAWLPDLIASRRGEPMSGTGAGVFASLRELTHGDVVTMAAVDGDTSGGGCELGWACDLRVAGDGARFAQPEIQLGLTTGIGGTSRLMRLIGPTAAAAMVLDGRPAPASRLHALGAVNRLVPTGAALDVAVEWATEIAGRSPAALAALKLILREAENLTLAEALRNEQAHFQSVVAEPDALGQMIAVQQRFEAGETPRDVYGTPLGP